MSELKIRINKYLALIPDDLISEPNDLVSLLKEAGKAIDALTNHLTDAEKVIETMKPLSVTVYDASHFPLSCVINGESAFKEALKHYKEVKDG